VQCLRAHIARRGLRAMEECPAVQHMDTKKTVKTVVQALSFTQHHHQGGQASKQTSGGAQLAGLTHVQHATKKYMMPN
jgi:hypothetical protein